ncbi:hypothetical protein CPB86DRAFT_696821 [Serendipita vermifera]|nr:hypothetical protein CPB86DRAFT_696821 [Serendipita vermifera]
MIYSVQKRELVLEDNGGTEEISLTLQSPAVQAAYVNKLWPNIFTTLTEVEIDEFRLPESAFVDARTVETPRKLENLQQFITKATPVLKTRLAQKPANKGAPTLLFIASAALRAADVTRSLRELRGKKGGEVAKLFAKHFKLEEQKEYLRRTSIGAGVGTAARIGKLLGEDSALSLTALTHIIIDASHRDAKMRTIFDIPETRDALLRDVLNNQGIQKVVQTGKVSIVLF